ncbi:SAM-dependent methyltransferase [Paenibacillus sp. W4I10]|uniref:class I SAM-dependent methyltransferase n=1 Tax=Paenibacillus sp. W4I10 TaxID=3042298 RepID=UPI00278AB514|nr:class I SAM-dependent methyltransferase [Paenibacillus sp. W4I10]MDQ0724082.1 SAM-dependent methyltransferase [Paenibacillus sp. W4I10]
MAILNLSYYDSSADEMYSDGDIENELLEYAKQSSYNWYSDKRWPIVYHLSPLRHNILNWFPFEVGSTILEIGAGCGALTGLLCERAKRVVSVELTKRRAEINFERHRHYDNLEILVSDFQKIPKNLKFDYVVVNGVLEYAAFMFDSADPYQAFLRNASNHLNPNGRMLLAIENRLGLKYFSGYKEDHTGKFFSGLNNYTAGEKVKTFSKGELTDLLSSTGLHALKFYYPYPDYKFPFEIFTDTTINMMKPAVLNHPMDMPRLKLFDESSVYQSFMNMQLMDRLSNSFLVEIASHPALPETNLSYVKISSNRSKKFAIFTGVDSKQSRVHKKALYEEGKAHLQHMLEYNQNEYNCQPDIRNIHSYEEEESVFFPYITEYTLEKNLLNSLHNEGPASFYKQFDKFKRKMLFGIKSEIQSTTAEFHKIFGFTQPQQPLHWAYNTNVDLVASNIFVQEEQYSVIDYEWHFKECMIPMQFPLWRMLKQFVNNHAVQSFFPDDVIQKLLGINEHTENCFMEWELNFAQNYVGIQDLSHLAQATLPVSLDKIAEELINESKLDSTLFYDLGSGFSEEYYERKTAIYVAEGFEVTFVEEHLSQSNVLRWDPLEGQPCHIQISNIDTDGTVYDIAPVNALGYTDEMGHRFLTYDPQFIIRGDFTEATFVKIRFACKIIDWTEAYFELEQKVQVNDKQLADINNELVYARQELNNTQQQLTHSRELTIESETRIEELTGELDYTQQLVNESQTKLNKVASELIEATAHFHHAQGELTNIHEQARNHRFKTALKVLLFGSVHRGKKGGKS